jgi:signal transduction histidine kinase
MNATLHRVGRAALLGPLAARPWRELGYLVTSTLLVGVCFAVLFGTVVVAPAAVVTLVGIPVLAFVVAGEVAASRWVGGLRRLLVAGLLGHRIGAPPPVALRPGLRGWLRTHLTDGDGWRALAHLVLTFPLLVVGLWATITTWAMGLLLLLYPVWWSLGDTQNVDDQGRSVDAGMVIGDWAADTWPEALLVALAGLVILWIVPWLTRLVVTIDRLTVRVLLGPGTLARRVADLQETRAHAVDDSAATLRRIERDLHDGAQARLVAVAMHLDMAREELAPVEAAAHGLGGPVPGGTGGGGAGAGLGARVLDGPMPTDQPMPTDATGATDVTPVLTDPPPGPAPAGPWTPPDPGAGGPGPEPDPLIAGVARARALVDKAHRDATEAIAELREVTRSIHPPALDSGLENALTTLAARSPLAVTLRAAVTPRPTPAVETMAYFCVAELLTNVARHSGSSRAAVDVGREGDWLRIRVSDDGRGGAAARPGGGLAGLAERVRTIDGRVSVHSPQGGPTVVYVDLPVGP